MTDIGNMKPRRFVREFQKRAGLLIDGVAGPQTRMALWLIPEMPPGRIYPAMPEMPEHLRTAPTPIDPADIRPGDVVEIREVVTVVEAASDYGPVVRNDGTTRTWHLIHRPDPDAEAVNALRDASWLMRHQGHRIDPLPGLPGLPEAADMLSMLREQGWDVVRRAES